MSKPIPVSSGSNAVTAGHRTLDHEPVRLNANMYQDSLVLSPLILRFFRSLKFKGCLCQQPKLVNKAAEANPSMTLYTKLNPTP